MGSAVVFSFAPDYRRAVVEELRRALPVESIHRVGDDAGLVELDGRGGALAAVAGACRDGRVRFVRHLAAADAVSDRSTLGSDPESVGRWASAAVTEDLHPEDEVCLHVWDSGDVAVPPGRIRAVLRAALGEAGVRVATAGATRTVSVCIGEQLTTAGVGSSRDGLVDWAGGRIRLAARPEQVSRAEFKLEELFTLVPLPQARVAVDLGASPGGWTRILRARGIEMVHAVDPGELVPRVAHDRGVVHHRRTAGAFLREQHTDGVDLIVNDMRMTPTRSARTMVAAAELLGRGGMIVLTLKLGTRHPLDEADRAIRELEQAYDVTFVRQLQHNRHELTVVAVRR